MVTVTLHSSIVPFAFIAVMVAIPSDIAVTTPLSSTVATDSSEELQVVSLGSVV